MQHEEVNILKNSLPDNLKDFINRSPNSSDEYPIKSINEYFNNVETLDYKIINRNPWFLAGKYYLDHPTRVKQANHTYFEALSIFHSIYQKLLTIEQAQGIRLGTKGFILHWISLTYEKMQYPVHAKRYMMLALIEDSIDENGKPYKRGCYARANIEYGLSEDYLKEYCETAYRIYSQYQQDDKVILHYYPEAILQDIQNKIWITELPSIMEALTYKISENYVKYLLEIEDKYDNKYEKPKIKNDGKILERLAEYLCSAMPGCRVSRDIRQGSDSDLDVICNMDGFDVDFRSELGRYFCCECKDWNKTVNISTVWKFASILDSHKSYFGIIFSHGGISGHVTERYANRERSRIFLYKGIVIVVIDRDDLGKISRGENLINLLRSKYEEIRLDLKISRIPEKDDKRRSYIDK